MRILAFSASLLLISLVAAAGVARPADRPAPADPDRPDAVAAKTVLLR
jgi:hypothetical protein